MRPRRPLNAARQVGRSQTDDAPAVHRHRPDYQLLVISSILLSIGLIVVYAISPGLAAQGKASAGFFVAHQLLTIGLGVVAFAVFASIPYFKLASLYKPLLIAAGVMTLIALVMPAPANYPAHRWIPLGSFSFQSVELVKFAILIYLAKFLSDRMADGKITNFKAIVKPLGALVGLMGIIVAGVQSDLGSTGVILVMVGAMVFVAGLPMRRLALLGLAVLTLTTVAIASTPYRRDRFETFMNPESDCQNAGYQACQALIAVGSGGMFGLGLGRSVQAYGYLPESQNDSIFAIYAEKFGFIGSLVLLALYSAFFLRLRRIIERAPDNYSRLIVVGIASWLSVQTLINIGAMVGLLPLKGITLPFVSYGGTSVLFLMAAVGMVFNISRYTNFSTPRIIKEGKEGKHYDNSLDRGRLRGAYHPNSSHRD